MQEGRTAFRTVIGKPTGRPRRSWENNIKMHNNAIGVNLRNLIYSAMDMDYWRALVNFEFNS